MPDIPHRHRVLSQLDVANEHGRVMRIRAIENRTHQFWIYRGYVEEDGKMHWQPFDDSKGHPTTKDPVRFQAWVQAFPRLAWAEDLRKAAYAIKVKVVLG